MARECPRLTDEVHNRNPLEGVAGDMHGLTCDMIAHGNRPPSSIAKTRFCRFTSSSDGLRGGLRMFVHTPVQQTMTRESGAYRLATILLATLCLLGLGGCPFVGLAYEDEMVAGYAVVAADSVDDAAIERRSGPNAGQVIGPMIFAYGWNSNFIIAKQHPVRDWPKVDRSTTCWFIVEVASGRVHGPLTEEQYIPCRQRIGVPPDLTFTKSIGRKAEE